MKLLEVQYMARQLFAQHNLKGWTFKFDTAKRRFGLCSYRKKTISMSRELTELNDESQVKDTLLHEIAHALAGREAGHSPAWKRVAREIGCNGERCYSSEKVNRPPPAYIGTCPNGHNNHYRHRRPTGRHSCSICSKGEFNPEYLITWKRV